MSSHETKPARTRSISEVYDQFIADPKHNWSKRTAVAHVTTRKWVVEVFGGDTPITDISREGCREFVDLLRSMPQHADKRFPNMSIREAVSAAKKQNERRLINTANLNAYVNRFGGVMNWALDEGYIERNPVRGLKLRDPVRKRDKRHPFSTDQLRAIFSAPIFTGCRNDEYHYAVVGDQRPRRARFWVPLIALFSGLRLNEICQLEVADIQHIEGVHCLRVMAGLSDAGQQKRVKTAASERIVPIHNELIRFGFLAFVEAQRLHGEVSLFPELPLGHLGYRSTSFSRWFSRFLVTAEASAPLTCFHSFRHNFRDGLRDAKVGRDLALILGGWTTEGSGSVVADIYGNGYRASALAEALNAVRFPTIDFSHLYAV
ncbi:hypothetical protein AOA14_06280 [Sphingopyxis terrae subsp. terrae NBRC 15098]|uniref:Tyr recombinase domain-containing protein n=1 Tax=Sphingopyxis terrae subsp. terrae NBRC 15098 TaxID=1219058 RepID=A0A142VWW0_9SPHN|nr:hypothetical protein AOA14_06280 [Sphingopyxis terrae subsp. terrae NBRC 15098]